MTRAWERFGPRARDVVFVAVALLAAFAETMARRDEGALVWAPVGAIAVLGALALWWRRRAPVVVTLIGLAVVATTGLPVVAVVGLFTLAVRRRDRVLAAVGALAIATFAITWSVGTNDSWARLVVSAVLVVGFFVAAGAYVGARRDLVAALRDRAARAEADQEVRAEQARLAERSRIAREMHDVLAHKVSLIALQAGALEVQAAPTPSQVAASAELIRATAREAMDDLREVLGGAARRAVPTAATWRRRRGARTSGASSRHRSSPARRSSCGWTSATSRTASPARPTASCARASRTCTSTRGTRRPS